MQGVSDTLKHMEKISKYPSTFYRISLKAVIRNERGEVLVVRENSGTWDLPGGGWDHGETAMACLKRELNEEVGYEGELQARLLGVTENAMYMPTKQSWLLWHVYDVTTENMNFSFGVDSDEMMFADPAQFRESASPIERLIAHYGDTVFRPAPELNLALLQPLAPPRSS